MSDTVQTSAQSNAATPTATTNPEGWVPGSGVDWAHKAETIIADQADKREAAPNADLCRWANDWTLGAKTIIADQADKKK
ncbi:hypothetical protein FS749_008922 [Ceratobasidium sp. UAMH 11750]|nr:hypothetical protein FS749_008922 [Ceratobasidium sp. UAMH 11750]